MSKEITDKKVIGHFPDFTRDVTKWRKEGWFTDTEIVDILLRVCDGRPIYESE